MTSAFTTPIPNQTVPEPGQLVEVRRRQWVVAEAPSGSSLPGGQPQHLVTLASPFAPCRRCASSPAATLPRAGLRLGTLGVMVWNGRSTRHKSALHQRTRRQWVARLKAGELLRCTRCGVLLLWGDDVDLDHLDGGDPGDYRGLAHRACNRSWGGRYGTQVQAAKRAGLRRPDRPPPGLKH